MGLEPHKKCINVAILIARLGRTCFLLCDGLTEGYYRSSCIVLAFLPLPFSSSARSSSSTLSDMSAIADDTRRFEAGSIFKVTAISSISVIKDVKSSTPYSGGA